MVGGSLTANTMIRYREIDDVAELQKIVEMEMAIWAMGPEGAVPHNMLIAIVHSGGVVIGADSGEGTTLVGFALALPARRPEGIILWSHMAGVLPTYQRQGIGLGLKLAQREWALAHDYPAIAWTFDPLQRGNANFNLRLLGAFSSTYHVNFYGDMTDSINAGMPSDRLEITWRLREERVTQAAEGRTPVPLTDYFPQENFLLYTDAKGDPCLSRIQTLAGDWHFIEIPYNISTLKRTNIQKAKAWQLMLRQSMQTALEQGYTVLDFFTDPVSQRCWYVLGKSNR